jgi:hypothetical protein
MMGFAAWPDLQHKRLKRREARMEQVPRKGAVWDVSSVGRAADF